MNRNPTYTLGSVTATTRVITYTYDSTASPLPIFAGSFSRPDSSDLGPGSCIAR